MRPLIRLAAALIRPQVDLRKAHALRQTRYGLALAILAGLAGFFGLALITVLLILAVGPIWALAIEFALSAIGAGVVFAVMRAEARRQAREAALLAQVQKQELRAAALAALPRGGGLGLVAAGLVFGLAFLLAAGGGPDSDSDSDPASTPDNDPDSSPGRDGGDSAA